VKASLRWERIPRPLQQGVLDGVNRIRAARLEIAAEARTSIMPPVGPSAITRIEPGGRIHPDRPLGFSSRRATSPRSPPHPRRLPVWSCVVLPLTRNHSTRLRALADDGRLPPRGYRSLRGSKSAGGIVRRNVITTSNPTRRLSKSIRKKLGCHISNPQAPVRYVSPPDRHTG
jgi:hypothetical protein